MKNLIYIVCIFYLLTILNVCNASEQIKGCADYVDFLIGSDMFHDPQYSGNNSLDPDFGLYANEIVGPRTPDGVVSPSPVSSFKGVTFHARGSGYCNSDKYIMGFPHINTEYNSYANLLLMPIVGTLYTDSGDKDNTIGYRALKDPQSEIAKAYYYSVKFKDSGIKTEITSTKHVGIHRYTFPKARSAKILLDLGITHKFSKLKDANLTFKGSDTIEGWQEITVFPSFKFYPPKVYFVVKFDKPIKFHGIWDEHSIYAHDKTPSAKKRKPNGTNIPKKLGAFVDYMTEENEQIQVKLAVSFKSIEDAYNNLEEAKGWDFEAHKENCRKKWNDYLSRIEVEGGTREQKRLFYTSMARCSNFASVEIISMLSTMNYQVLFLLEPKSITEKICNIVETGYVRRGFFGNGFIPYSLSFFKRGAKEIDLNAIYNKYFKLLNDPNYERYAEYIKNGYLHSIKRPDGSYKMNDDCANRTLGYAYEFYCLSEMGKLLQKPTEEIDFLKKHSYGYKNVFDKTTGFVRGKDADGKWLEPFDPTEATIRNPYNEGNAWQYTFMIFHDIPWLIDSLGGKKAFVAKLDEMFSTPYHSIRQDISGMIGNYTHGNGNDRYVPYLYIEADAAWKTQEMTRKILDVMYKDIPGGLTNNDDYGNMSGWYVMSAMGIYPPINPALCDNFLLTSPLFKKITIRLPEYIYGGNIFTIECENYAPENIYIDSVELDGKPLRDFKMPVDALKNAKRLVFKMSKHPRK